MKIILAGVGAFGEKHLAAIRRIGGIEVVSLVGRDLEKTRAAAARHQIAHATTSLEQALRLPQVEAAILCTPTQVHGRQAIECLDAGKHVQVEIPVADSWQDAQAVAEAQRRTGLVCMVGHTRRFNPSHQWIHQRIQRSELCLLHMNVQTFFFRRTNLNALGQPRSWTDHLLWHHAAHTVDLFRYQAGEEIAIARGMEGPHDPNLKIAMDMSIQLKTRSGVLCTLALSFNNDGPLGTFYRYICDHGTYIARYDDLVTGKDEKVDVSHVDVSLDGIELQDREFFAAIQEGREPNASVHQVLPSYRTLYQIEQGFRGLMNG